MTAGIYPQYRGRDHAFLHEQKSVICAQLPCVARFLLAINTKVSLPLSQNPKNFAENLGSEVLPFLAFSLLPCANEGFHTRGNKHGEEEE